MQDRAATAAQFVRAVPRTGEMLSFAFDGEALSGYAGETVMTALLCATSRVRRFEFSDTDRAGFCVMAACQDCWLWMHDGERIRACTTPLAAGMRLWSAAPPAPGA
jgi:hypothetical protein